MKTKDIFLAIATLIGLIVLGGWAFRVLGNFLDGLLWWFRYNGIYIIGAIAILYVIWSVLVNKDKS